MEVEFIPIPDERALLSFLRESKEKDEVTPFAMSQLSTWAKTFYDLLEQLTETEMHAFRLPGSGRARWSLENVRLLMTWRNWQLFVTLKLYTNGLKGPEQAEAMSETRRLREVLMRTVFRGLEEEYRLILVDGERRLREAEASNSSIGSGILRPLPDKRHGSLGDIAFELRPIMPPVNIPFIKGHESSAYLGTMTHNRTSYFWLEFFGNEMPWPEGFKVDDKKVEIFTRWKSPRMPLEQFTPRTRTWSRIYRDLNIKL